MFIPFAAVLLSHALYTFYRLTKKELQTPYMSLLMPMKIQDSVHMGLQPWQINVGYVYDFSTQYYTYPWLDKNTRVQ